MNNRQIASFLKQDPVTRQSFGGVFSANTLPEIIRNLPIGYVVNTAKDTHPGEHWISIWIGKNGQKEYFDSYGLPPLNEEIESFLEPFYKYNDKRLQNLTSATCGQYCIYYIWHRARKKSMKEIVKRFTSNYARNDCYVNNFVENKWNTDLDIYDTSFQRLIFSRSIK